MKKKEQFKTTIGGQALIEGVYMRGPEKASIAIRKPDGGIYTETFEINPPPLKKVPLVRGVVSMIYSLISGYKSIMKSADIAFAEELEKIEENEGQEDTDRAEKDEKKEDKLMNSAGVIGAVLGGLLSIALFVVAPTFITGLIDKIFPLGGFKAAVEGVLKIILFLAYLFLVTRIKDIRRVFEYHGAEHKTIACYEAMDELTPLRVKEYSRFHPRCGTSFLFLVVIVSIAIFSFIPFTGTLARAGIKLLFIPVIMGIAYEILRYAGRRSNLLSAILSAPGKWVQRLTAFEPDESQMEVAIAALREVIPEGGENAG